MGSTGGALPIRRRSVGVGVFSGWCVVPWRQPSVQLIRLFQRSECLAPVGVHTICGIEFPGSVGNGDQFAPGRLERLDARVEILQVIIKQSHHVLARRFTSTSLVENRGYLSQGQTSQLSVLDESESVDRVGPVGSVPIGGAFGLIEHADLLVVADCLCRDAGETSEFSDVHGPNNTPPDIPAGWKVRLADVALRFAC